MAGDVAFPPLPPTNGRRGRPGRPISGVKHQFQHETSRTLSERRPQEAAAVPCGRCAAAAAAHRQRRVPCVTCARAADAEPSPSCACTPRPVRVTPRRQRQQRQQQTHSRPALLLRDSAVVLLAISCLVRPCAGSPARHKSPPSSHHWKNPCSLPVAALTGEAVHSVPPATDRQIIDRIVHLNGMVAPKIDHHLTQFVLTTYQREPAAMRRDWGHHRLDWLQWLDAAMAGQRRQLAERRLPLRQALLQHFLHLQRLAVALEQSTLEAALHGDHSLDSFRHVQADLMLLLCELHLGLLEKRAPPEVDGAAAQAAAAERHGEPESERARHLRDWILLSEYQRYVQHMDRTLRTLRRQQDDRR